MDKSNLDYVWQTLIKNYSAHDFTNFEDRLPAIAGIAKVFSDTWKDDYVAGLWRGLLINQLCWYRARGQWSFSSEQHPFEPFSQITERIRWPSWSWKSAPLSVDFSYITIPAARVIGYNIKLASTEAPFGDVLEGILTLRAKLVSFSAELPEELLRSRSLILDHETTKIDSSTQLLLFGFSTDPLNFTALIVRTGPNDSFERIGLVFNTLRTLRQLDWEPVDEQTVILR
jgi:hypothetical protein